MMQTIYRAGNANSYTEFVKELGNWDSFNTTVSAYLESGTVIPNNAKVTSIKFKWQVYGENRIIEAVVFSRIKLFDGKGTQIADSGEKEKGTPDGKWHGQSGSLSYNETDGKATAEKISKASPLQINIWFRKTDSFVSYTTGVKDVKITIEWEKQQLKFTSVNVSKNPIATNESFLLSAEIEN